MGDIIWVGHGGALAWVFKPKSDGHVSLCYDYYNGGESPIISAKFYFSVYDADGNIITCKHSGKKIKPHTSSVSLKPGKWAVGRVMKDAWQDETAVKATCEKVIVTFEGGMKRVYDKEDIVIKDNSQYDRGLAPKV